MFLLSLPMRERGLKYLMILVARIRAEVAPHAGAWIEIRKRRSWWYALYVAPHAGAWIEM